VADYRIYTLENGRNITGPAKILDCTTDDHAIEEAKALLDGHDIEVWQGARLIIRLQSNDK
jgi:hypothetical protein